VRDGWGRRTGFFVAKELRELRRDRRALLVMFVIPVLIYPALFTFTTHLERQRLRETQAAVFRVAVTGPATGVREAVEAAKGLVLSGEADSAAVSARMAEGGLDVWVDSGADGAMFLRYDGSRDDSEEALARVEEVLEEVRARERDRRYRAAGGAGSLADAVEIREVDVATEEEAAGATAGRRIPYLLIFTLFLGGASVAVDVVAGEKERGTLETLYLTPVPRLTIARAKFLVVVGATMLTGTLNLASLAVCYRLGLIGDAGTGAAVELSTAGLAACFVLTIPLAAVIGGLLLGISAFARSMKEAQYYVMPMMMVAFVPGLLSMTQDVRLTGFTALIPVANVSIALRDALRGDLAAPMLALVTAASLFWAALVLRWTAGVLSREDTILGFDPEPLFGRTRGGRRRAAWLGIAGTTLGFFYVGQILQNRDLLRGLALSLWVLLPLMAAAAVRFAWPGGGSVAALLSLRRPTLRALLGAAALGAGLFVPMVRGVFVLQSSFLPMPGNLFEFLESGFDDIGLPVLLLLIAVSPGVCEELVFRGAFLGLLRRTGTTRAAVIGSSVFFALIHLSVFRFVPTFLLGATMGAIVVRTRSIFPAMLFHMVYNGTTVVLGSMEELPAFADGAAGWGVSLALLGAGALLLWTGDSADGSAEQDDAAGARGALPLQAEEVDSRRDR
jgi:sodium transport system permease protein